MWQTINKLVLILTAAVCIAQMVVWYGQLPDPMPSHFDAAGNVDGESSRLAFYLTIGLVNAMLLILFPLMSKMMKSLPDSLINLPNKEYWLAASRRENTLARISGHLTTFGWATCWFMMVTFHLTSQVAIQTRTSIQPEFAIALVAFLIFTFGWIGIMTWCFRIPSSDINRSDSAFRNSGT